MNEHDTGRREAILGKIMDRVDVRLAGYETECWLWTGPDSGKEGRGAGYPRMSLNGQTVAVHLVMWTNANGFLPGKKQIDHKCRNRLCVRPSHLEMVTQRQNLKRIPKCEQPMSHEPEWVDVTTVGSEYEEQLDIKSASNRMRHRKRAFTGQDQYEWQEGPAPK